MAIPKLVSLLLALVLAFPMPALAQHLESAWLDAAAPFENPGSNGKVVTQEGAVVDAPVTQSKGTRAALKLEEAVEKLKEARERVQTHPKPGSSASVPSLVGPKHDPDLPKGIGPVSWERKPGYLKGLLGGLLGFFLAPIAFAVEAVQAVALMPVRMVKGVINGQPEALLEPFRTAKNLVQDAALTVAGMLNSATAPVWNAVRPDEATDFVYANNRLIFQGGPLAAIIDAADKIAGAPSMHTVFARRKTDGADYRHEFVHNQQWKRSFAWEHVVEPGDEGWNKAEAEDYLNW